MICVVTQQNNELCLFARKFRAQRNAVMKTSPLLFGNACEHRRAHLPRCHGTGDEMLGALDRLRAALALGAEPQLETVELNEAVFFTRPSESNRI